MCGIAGFYLREPIDSLNLEKLLDSLLDGIDHRGGDATGYAAFGSEGLLAIQKAACDAKEFSRGRKALPDGTRYVLAHTRLATQGHQAWPENNHPVVSGKTVAIHNGHIWNDTSLWTEAGWEKREAEVDSEIIPAMIEHFGWDHAAAALETLEGAFAVAIANHDRPGELILAKGESSPLVYAVTDKLIVWASTEWTLLQAWQKAIGSPPRSEKVRSLKLGGIMNVVDGRITHSTFTPSITIYKSTRQSETERKTQGGVYSWDPMIQAYVEETTGAILNDPDPLVVKGKRGNPRKPAHRFDAQAWPELTGYADDEEGMVAEINDMRKRTNTIMTIEEWWEDEDMLALFNRCWERIRILREKVESKHFDRAMDTDELEPMDSEIEIGCESCKEFYPLTELHGTDMLYCSDCWFYFQDNGIVRPIDRIEEDDWCDQCGAYLEDGECPDDDCEESPYYGGDDDNGRIHSRPLGNMLELVMRDDG